MIQKEHLVEICRIGILTGRAVLWAVRAWSGQGQQLE
jgi:hypothetical protein